MKKEQSSKHCSNACILIALQLHVCVFILASSWSQPIRRDYRSSRSTPTVSQLLALLTSRRGVPETTWGSSISMSSGLYVTLPGSSAGRPSRQKPKTLSRFHFKTNNSNMFSGSAASPTERAFRSTSHCLFPNTWSYLALENGNAVKRQYL